MAIELDHIFVQVSKGFPEKNRIKDLPIGNHHRHQGQGTEAEFLAFERNYLEFIWLADKETAAQNPLKLQKRFLASCCPFGIAFRGTLGTNQLTSFWQYKPQYLPQGCIWIHKSWNEDCRLPALFVLDLERENSASWPAKNPRWRDTKILPGGFAEIIISGPADKPDFDFPQLRFKNSHSYSLEIVGIPKLNLESMGLISNG